MLWEIYDDIRQYIKMTFIPSMRNLFSSIRSFAGIFLVMTVLQLLLSVICIFGIENIKNQQTVLDNFQGQLAGISDAVQSTEGSFITSDEFKTALSSTSIFIGALVIWGVCALSVYAKVTFASADRDKYIWGMYITHGAKKKKVRAMLKNELYLPHLLAVAVSYPLAIYMCNAVMSDGGKTYSHSLLTLAVILLLSYVCIRLVVMYEGFVIRSMSCTELLREEDSPKSVCFPRRHSKLIRGFTSQRYGRNTFWRMRKYYVSLALIAAVPAVMWVCFQVSSTSEDLYLDSDIKEFSVSMRSPIDDTQLQHIALSELGKLDGVSDVSSVASYDAGEIYTHLLLDRQYYSSIADSPYYTTTYADNTAVICQNNIAFRQTVGVSIANVRKGTVSIIYPQDAPEYNLAEGSRIFFAISKLDGNIRTLDESATELLRTDLKEQYTYIELTVGEVLALPSASLSGKQFTNVTDTYFVLNNEDYEKITHRSLDSLSDSIDTESYSYETVLNSDASFNITLPKNKFTESLIKGNIADISGRINMNVTFETDGDRYEMSVMSRSFDYSYINSVSIMSDSVVINVTPYCVIELSTGVMTPTLLAIGTPDVPSSKRQYFASTCEGFTATNGSVTLNDSKLHLRRSSALNAAEIGVHTILSDKNIVDVSDKVKLEELYGDNLFKISCGDTYTPARLGYEFSSVNKGGAILVLPKNSHLSLSVGDKLRVAVTLENVSNLIENSEQLSRYDTLEDHMKNNAYDYVVVYIDDIIYSDTDSPELFLSEEDFSKVINKSAPYTSFDISISSGIESEDYSALREQISKWVSTSRSAPVISSTGEYLKFLLKKNANYQSVILLISTIIPLVVPFLWYYPLASLFDRRRNEIMVLRAMGKKKRTVRASFLHEGVLVSITAFLSVILMCAPAMLIFKTVCSLAKLPLEFEYKYLSLSTLAVAGAFSAVCAFISFWICYATTSSRKKTGKIRRKYGNS